MFDINKIVKRIKQARRAKHITAEAFAERIEISVSFLREIERGSKIPTQSVTNFDTNGVKEQTGSLLKMHYKLPSAEIGSTHICNPYCNSFLESGSEFGVRFSANSGGIINNSAASITFNFFNCLAVLNLFFICTT